MCEKSLFNTNAFHTKCCEIYNFNFLKLFLYFFLFKVEKYFQNYVLYIVYFVYLFVILFCIFVLSQFKSIIFNLNNFISILILPESHYF